METVIGAKEWQECDECNGLGYLVVGSTTEPEENVSVECGKCEGVGEVELEASEIF